MINKLKRILLVSVMLMTIRTYAETYTWIPIDQAPFIYDPLGNGTLTVPDSSPGRHVITDPIGSLDPDGPGPIPVSQAASGRFAYQIFPDGVLQEDTPSSVNNWYTSTGVLSIHADTPPETTIAYIYSDDRSTFTIYSGIWASTTVPDVASTASLLLFGIAVLMVFRRYPQAGLTC